SQRFLNFVVVLGLAYVMLREWQSEVQVITKTPVSKYHKRGNLAPSLQGILLHLDIKKSESLLRFNEPPGFGAAMLEDGVAKLCAVIARNNGTVLSTEGDAVVAFFEEGYSASMLDKVKATCRELDASLNHFSGELNAMQIHSLDSRLFLRIAIARGEIRPVWHDLGDYRCASWVGAGDENMFLVASRLADVERQIPDADKHSLLVMKTELADELVKGARGTKLAFIVRGVTYTVKHGQSYDVSACALDTDLLPVAKS